MGPEAQTWGTVIAAGPLWGALGRDDGAGAQLGDLAGWGEALPRGWGYKKKGLSLGEGHSLRSWRREREALSPTRRAIRRLRQKPGGQDGDWGGGGHECAGVLPSTSPPLPQAGLCKS